MFSNTFAGNIHSRLVRGEVGYMANHSTEEKMESKVDSTLDRMSQDKKRTFFQTLIISKNT